MCERERVCVCVSLFIARANLTSSVLVCVLCPALLHYCLSSLCFNWFEQKKNTNKTSKQQKLKFDSSHFLFFQE